MNQRPLITATVNLEFIYDGKISPSISVFNQSFPNHVLSDSPFLSQSVRNRGFPHAVQHGRANTGIEESSSVP
jgi:hypothetical protein